MFFDNVVIVLLLMLFVYKELKKEIVLYGVIFIKLLNVVWFL